MSEPTILASAASKYICISFKHEESEMPIIAFHDSE